MWAGIAAFRDMFTWSGGQEHDPVRTMRQRRLEKEVPRLNQREKVLFDVVANHLEAANASHSPQSDFHAIIIRHAKSWHPVKDQFLCVFADDQAVLKWKNKWINYIYTFEAKQDTLSTLRQLMIEEKKNPHPNLNALKATFAEIKTQLDSSVTKATDYLKANLNDPVLLNNPVSAPILEMLQQDWPYLMVFAEWTNVPLNEEGVQLRVRIPTPDEITSLTDPAWDPLQTDRSRQGVFITQKVDYGFKCKKFCIEPRIEFVVRLAIDQAAENLAT